MQCWKLLEYGKSLVRTKVRHPVAQNDKTLIVKVHSVGINPIDYKIANGYGRRILPKPPKILGYEFSGVVAYGGLFQDRLKAGDEVCGCLTPLSQGALSEYIAVDPKYVTKKPKHLSLVEASCFLYPMLTVWPKVYQKFPNANVLIIGASGGIGHLLMQCARSCRARCIHVVCSKQSADFVRQFEPDNILFYDEQEYQESLSHLSNIDLVVDLVGRNIENCLPLMSKGATYITPVSPALDLLDEKGLLCGGFALVTEKFRHDIRCYNDGGKKYRWTFHSLKSEMLERIGEFFESNEIKVKVSEVFNFEKVNEALETLREKRNIVGGKVAVKVSENS